MMCSLCLVMGMVIPTMSTSGRRPSDEAALHLAGDRHDRR